MIELEKQIIDCLCVIVDDDNATEFVLLRLADDDIVEMLSVAFTIYLTTCVK